MINHHDALIYTMVLASAADRNMSDAELRTMGEIVSFLPIFEDFDHDRLPNVARACAELLLSDTGLDTALDLIKKQLTPELRETAYAVACDVVAADRKVSQETLRLLELLRQKLEIDDLIAAAIERATRARHRSLGHHHARP